MIAVVVAVVVGIHHNFLEEALRNSLVEVPVDTLVDIPVDILHTLEGDLAEGGNTLDPAAHSVDTSLFSST